jgi:hypothetical protein
MQHDPEKKSWTSQGSIKYGPRRIAGIPSERVKAMARTWRQGYPQDDQKKKTGRRHESTRKNCCNANRTSWANIHQISAYKIA